LTALDDEAMQNIADGQYKFLATDKNSETGLYGSIDGTTWNHIDLPTELNNKKLAVISRINGKYLFVTKAAMAYLADCASSSATLSQGC